MPHIEDAIKEFCDKNIDKQLEMLINKSVYIYGAGSFGVEMSNLFADKGISVEAFLDVKAAEMKLKNGIKVFHPEDGQIVKEKDTIVVFSIVMSKDDRLKTIKFIKECGFSEIVEAQGIRCMLVEFRKSEAITSKEYLKSHERDILDTLNIWGDEKSKEIYTNNIIAHFTGDYSGCIHLEDDMNEQYFPNDIELRKGYLTFVDCGGFVGDTVTQLLSKRNDVECIISYEPNTENFEELSKACDKTGKKMLLFPCAVSDSVDFKYFSGTGGSGSVSDVGSERVQSVSLDMTLKNIEPTFIKMDIEGEEIAALKGAEKILRESNPDLAICVYHYISDLWEIPRLIKKFNRNYKIYLRSYNAYTMETVLYATV